MLVVLAYFGQGSWLAVCRPLRGQQSVPVRWRVEEIHNVDLSVIFWLCQSRDHSVVCLPPSLGQPCMFWPSLLGWHMRVLCITVMSTDCKEIAWQIYMGAWIWRRMFLGKIFYFIEDTEGFTCCVQGMVLGWWKYGNVVCKTAAKKSQCGRGTALGNSLTRCRHSAETVGGRGKPFTTCNSWLALEKATAILPTSNRLPLGVSSLAHPQQPRIMKGKKCWREQV